MLSMGPECVTPQPLIGLANNTDFAAMEVLISKMPVVML